MGTERKSSRRYFIVFLPMGSWLGRDPVLKSEV
uniref:Uncharacterized protein n=1 Tax=Nelumbo nucifera TaxID=4432 RepID=A0A822ZNS7_NELNU|nr:TPA_asm: hypothetical protein HUJ06_016484 [Nelumbo nucifera]